MKYWLLTTEYPPMHGGGISTYCYLTAQMLCEAGYTVTIFTPDDSVKDFSVSSETHNIRVIRFNSNRDAVHSFLGYSARLSYAFAGIIKAMVAAEGKPDFIEAQDYLGIAYYITQFKHAGYGFLEAVPIIITLHSPAFIYLAYNRVPTYRYPDFWTGEMEKQAIVAADALISPTNYLVKEIEKHISLSRIKLGIIPNPYQAVQVIKTEFKRNKIIYYGKLSPQKGIFELLIYFKELWDSGFKYPLHIIGGSDIVYHPDQQTMGQLVFTKYKEYIKKGLLLLQGKITPSQIKDSIGDAHLVIVPSIVDNMPYVVMEAMTLGKIVLASKQGGQSEMITDGFSGFLFDHEVPSTFFDQLNRVLLLDDKDVQKIGHQAKQSIIDFYSFDIIITKKSTFLNQVKLNTDPGNTFPFLHQESEKQINEAVFTKDLLSIVVPFYNMGNYIGDCIQSITKSTYKKIEILIINDGSDINSSIEKLQEFTTKNNIRIINTSNKGLAAARNFGALNAKGEFLAYLDADDKVAPSYYEKAIHTLLKNKNVYFVGSWVQYFENSHSIWPTFTPQPPYALVHNPVNSSGLVYKRNAFLTAGINDAKTDYGLEDYESLVNMLHNGLNGVVLPEVLFFYRVRTGSMIRNISKEKLLYSNKYIAVKHVAYYSKFAIQIINLLNANGPGYLYDNPTFSITVSTNTSVENMHWFKVKNFIKKNEHLKNIALTLKRKFTK